jgi:hypothetical protein
MLTLSIGIIVFWQGYVVYSAFIDYPTIHDAIFGVGDVRGLLSYDILVSELIAFFPLMLVMLLSRKRRA